MATRFTNVDEYVASFPADVQRVLAGVRRVALDAVPGGAETISYQMPTVTLDGVRIVHFAGWKRHVSVYPAPELGVDAELDAALAAHRGDKGTLKFSLRDPLPLELIGRVVAALLRERTATG
jgi:uncharacterized protein YdhG (YjbR/CyaY superfamily)